MNIENKQKEYLSAEHSIFALEYHVIFCTKFRRKIFINEGLIVRAKQLIKEKQSEFNFKCFECEIMPDHIHLLIGVLNPKLNIYTVISKIKGMLSKILREEFPEIKSKIPSLWSRGKFISSVGSVSLDVVKRYIEGQKK
jgi:putative transposase